MTVKDIEVRGRKEICAFLGVQNWFTAKKRLQRLGVLAHDGGKPVLNLEEYKEASKSLPKVEPKNDEE
ncbi:MAG: hypothetical protein C4542_07205 [Dehalococcoidia bacterium]|nr:MAG: hypothetical protein C4542_07205 [Dehalococcoidia bacterium]